MDTTRHANLTSLQTVGTNLEHSMKQLVKVVIKEEWTFWDILLMTVFGFSACACLLASMVFLAMFLHSTMVHV